jgi:hypothetical protein
VSGTTSIEKLWDQLDPKTQEWLRANPGSVVLPRNVTAVIRKAMGDPDSLDGTDRNEQLSLSPEDLAFITAMANSAPLGCPQTLRPALITLGGSGLAATALAGSNALPGPSTPASTASSRTAVVFPHLRPLALPW